MRIDHEVVAHRAHQDDQVIKSIAEAVVEVVAMTIAKLSDQVNVEVQFSRRSP